MLLGCSMHKQYVALYARGIPVASFHDFNMKVQIQPEIEASTGNRSLPYGAGFLPNAVCQSPPLATTLTFEFVNIEVPHIK